MLQALSNYHEVFSIGVYVPLNEMCRLEKCMKHYVVKRGNEFRQPFISDKALMCVLWFYT